MLCLYLQAPFGVFRTFMAGSFRPTAEFITPSAAYGLLLNIAGIEMRRDDGKSPMTLIAQGMPVLQIALGAIEFPLQHSLYQQLHNYPVGSTGKKERAPSTKGNKYNIAPVRRAVLSDIRAYLCFDGDNALETAVRRGLAGNMPRKYGLPFLGDNNFLLDRFEPVENLMPAYWFRRVAADDEGLRNRVTRLTITIDRQDMAKTVSRLFAPNAERTAEIPQDAWIRVGYP